MFDLSDGQLPEHEVQQIASFIISPFFLPFDTKILFSRLTLEHIQYRYAEQPGAALADKESDRSRYAEQRDSCRHTHCQLLYRRAHWPPQNPGDPGLSDNRGLSCTALLYLHHGTCTIVLIKHTVQDVLVTHTRQLCKTAGSLKPNSHGSTNQRIVWLRHTHAFRQLTARPLIRLALSTCNFQIRFSVPPRLDT